MRQRSIFATVAAAALLVLGTGRMALSDSLGATTSSSTSAVAAATAGCGKTPTLRSGSQTITTSGKNRSWILRIPDNYDNNRPYRLIFAYHWLNGTAQIVDTGGSDGAVWSYYGLKQLSNNSTIFIAPQGINNGWGNTNGEDLTFTDDVLRLVESNLCVDTTQRFAMGWSYGGAMSFAVACARPTIFRAVAVYSGAQLSGCSGGTQPVAYMGIHGIHDSVLNISNGRSLRDRFVTNNGCTPMNPREPAQGSLTHIITAYSGCRDGYPVVWAAFDGDHTPSPNDGSTSTSGARTWTSAEVWKFFTQFQSGPSTSPSPSPSPSSPTSPSPSPSPSASPSSGGSGACRVSATVNAWGNGLTEDITITNTGSSALNGWSLAFTLPGGQTITNGWNATYSPNSGQVTAKNVSYNGSLPSGTSVQIGFQATHTGNAAKPTAFTLNGSPCTIA
ncbi:cellulose binding domain-containing protein [Microbispora sp. NPDC088329]|uniref:cellulose binding domain-containing protein n=1 Tax=Microbispora sp. NPDC088329 TaxID=3154869 RepID=UPI003427EC21